jgi:hypothetical protein
MGRARRTYRRKVYMVFMLKPEEKTPLGRSTCEWEDNIKTVLQEARREL